MFSKDNSLLPSEPAPFEKERLAMVEQQLRQRGIHDERVLEAMRSVPRHEFVAPVDASEAYADRPVPIGEQQTTSQPYIIAAMLQAVAIKPTDRVLEIGAGSGYQTALLAELANRVFAVDRHASLVEAAGKVLDRLGYHNVALVVGDGTLGLEQAAPFDVIVVSAAAPRIPEPLVEQLAVGGRMIVPVGDSEQQVLKLIRKYEGGVAETTLEGCRFVPLIGVAGFGIER
jgi:protein-L-isoaspartate(D-aspartate) O-methyltransferase